MVLIAGQSLDPFPLGLDQSSAEDRCAQWKFISVCVSCSQRERRKEPSMKGKHADWKARLSLPSRLQGSHVCDTNTCSSFRTEARPPEARPPAPDRPADAWSRHWLLHPQSPQQGPGLRMQMPLSREGLLVDFILKAPGTGIGEGACPPSPNCSQRDAVWSPSFHPWELLASRESLLKCDCAQTHSPCLSQAAVHGLPQASFSALPAAPGRPSQEALGPWRHRHGRQGAQEKSSLSPSHWSLRYPEMVPLGGGGWAVAHILDISESGVTRVTWGLWHGQDLQQVTSKVASVVPSAPAPGPWRTRVLPLELETMSKVPAQAQPLAAAFSGSVTHLSSQGGAQGDEFGDGQR